MALVKDKVCLRSSGIPPFRGCVWSDCSWGINSSAVSDRNPRLVRASYIRLFVETPPHSGCIPGRKVRDRDLLPHTNHIKTQFGGSKDGVAMSQVVRAVDCSDVSLRQWLDNAERSVDALECLHIFTQIVEIVNLAHSQGIVVQNVRPSCFVMSSFNHVSFIESASCSDSGSDSCEDGSNSQTAEFKGSSSPLPHDLNLPESQLGLENSQLELNPANTSQIVSETSCLQSSSASAMRVSWEASNVEQADEKKHPFPMKEILIIETNWYTSPEEVAGTPGSCASDIYRLGILLFELFCSFSSAEDKRTTMASLRHRVLPPQLLLKWPKEASFCLWLLHPEPSSRPKLE
ncbi:unnamed protein product [Ilex paraguariensis]|uniref:Protein kinase domain-containing protein n=1 Tax=Ilex paraguariensis TaxID=185542 RepID=A0ABC8R0L6_9AQUA